MKIYKISQDTNTDYDTYDSAVVAAESEEAAQKMHPSKYNINKSWWEEKKTSNWVDIEQVLVEYLGEAKEGTEAGVIVSSFNAG